MGGGFWEVSGVLECDACFEGCVGGEGKGRTGSGLSGGLVGRGWGCWWLKYKEPYRKRLIRCGDAIVIVLKLAVNQPPNMDSIVDGIGNTTVVARDDGSHVLTTGSKSITLLKGTFEPQSKITAEFRNGHYYTAYYHELGVTFVVLSPKNINGYYGMEQDLKYWEPIYCPFRDVKLNSGISWRSKDPTTWGRNEWQYTEIDSTLDWFFKPSTSGASDSLTGTAKKADIFALTGTPEFGADTADRITNFNPKEKDRLQIDVSDFGSNAAGTFKIANNPKALTKALASTTNFIYLKSTGELYYNENGKLPGYGDGGIFAILENKANITTKNVEFL